MDKTNLLIATAFVGLGMTLSGESALARDTQLLNHGWRYFKGDTIGAEKTDFDDTRWENIGLPHSFSIPYFMSKDFYVGFGWYRKTVEMSKSDLEKYVTLDFEGVFQDCEVFVNGRKMGRHVGGYTGFSIDITKALRAGTNVVAVRVNNLWHPDVAPRAGEHTFSGGIYRNVRLVKKTPVHIAWCGTFVTTPDLASTEGRSSRVKIGTEVVNNSSREDTYTLVTTILNPRGDVVAKATSKKKVAAQSTVEFIQQTASIANPLLWSHDTPMLYKAQSQLYRGKKLLDSDTTEFGFRWMTWTADKGFFFNGNHMYIQGANVHQDQAGWGDAVPDSAARRDVVMMRDAGFNFIRGSHYPHSPAFVEACDKEGMLFWSEAPFWGIGGFRPDGYWNASAYPVDSVYNRAFDASALQQLEEMIRIYRNHPSIVAWSMCNEPFFSDPKVMNGVKGLLRKMVDRSHRLDSTRVAAIGGAQRPLGDGRIDRIGDVAGYNGDGATQPDFQNPAVPSVVSEYGSKTADRPGSYSAGWGDLAKGEAWKGLEWRSGQAIWCGFDHGSIAGEALGKMGIVDYFRLPKRSWYWYRKEYSGVKPPEWPRQGVPAQLSLVASKVSKIATDGTDDVQLVVSVCDKEGKALSDTPTVTLKVVSGPGEFPTGRSITFSPMSDIRIQDGKAAITLRSYYAGRSVIEAVSEGLASARLELSFKGEYPYVEGKTPLVVSRPYERFVRKADTPTLLTLGLNNPVFVSSSADGFTSGLAADGNVSTFWKAQAADSRPFCLLDMEKEIDIAQIEIIFGQINAYKCTIEVSSDKTHWSVVKDLSANTTPMKNVRLGKSGKARYVRMTFVENTSERPASVAEMIVKGYTF